MRWRPMAPADLPAVEAIGARVHPNHPEHDRVFAERLRLHPPGCLVLQADDASLAGYCVSHPWLLGQPPRLDTLLGALPSPADTYYIHDIALLAETRRSGAGAAAVHMLTGQAVALRLASMSLIAIGGSPPFWERQGFRVQDDPELVAKLRSYGPAARFMVRAPL